MMDAEAIEQALSLEKYVAALEQHHEIIEKQILELEHFLISLEKLDKSSDKDFLASLGKGVYLPSTMKEKKLFVEIGADVVIQKTPQQVKEVIVEQITRLRESSRTIAVQREFSANHLNDLMRSLEAEHAESHAHSKN